MLSRMSSVSSTGVVQAFSSTMSASTVLDRRLHRKVSARTDDRRRHQAFGRRPDSRDVGVGELRDASPRAACAAAGRGGSDLGTRRDGAHRAADRSGLPTGRYLWAPSPMWRRPPRRRLLRSGSAPSRWSRSPIGSRPEPRRVPAPRFASRLSSASSTPGSARPGSSRSQRHRRSFSTWWAWTSTRSRWCPHGQPGAHGGPPSLGGTDRCLRHQPLHRVLPWAWQ